MSTKMKFPMKKLALGVSSAIVVLGAQPASADAILFPYVVNGGAVTTILSAVATRTIPDDPADFRFDQSLHYAYSYKAPAAASDPTPWDEPCEELDFYNPSSVADIVTFNIGAVMNVAQNGVLFETNPFVPPFDPGKRVFYPENFGQFPAGHRGYVTVDNNAPGSAGLDGTLYGEALILDFTNGAAFGYRAYNPATNNVDLTNFHGPYDALGEVLTNINSSASQAPAETGAFEMYPGDQFTQKMLITPIPDVPPAVMNGDAAEPLVVARVGAGPSFQTGSFGTTSMYDRDENPVSGRNNIPVVCVGAPDLKEFFTLAALTKYNEQGGWTTVSPLRLPADANIGTVPADFTGNMIAQKLSYTAGPIEGVAIGGTLNSNVWLQSTRLPSVPGGTSLFGYVWTP